MKNISWGNVYLPCCNKWDWASFPMFKNDLQVFSCELFISFFPLLFGYIVWEQGFTRGIKSLHKCGKLKVWNRNVKSLSSHDSQKHWCRWAGQSLWEDPWSWVCERGGLCKPCCAGAAVQHPAVCRPLLVMALEVRRCLPRSARNKASASLLSFCVSHVCLSWPALPQDHAEN